MYFKLKRQMQKEKEYRSSLLNDRPLAESPCFSLDTIPLKGQASLICLLFNPTIQKKIALKLEYGLRYFLPLSHFLKTRQQYDLFCRNSNGGYLFSNVLFCVYVKKPV
jgi:hypothetical protein